MLKSFHFFTGKSFAAQKLDFSFELSGAGAQRACKIEYIFPSNEYWRRTWVTGEFLSLIPTQNNTEKQKSKLCVVSPKLGHAVDTWFNRGVTLNLKLNISFDTSHVLSHLCRAHYNSLFRYFYTCRIFILLPKLVSHSSKCRNRFSPSSLISLPMITRRNEDEFIFDFHHFIFPFLVLSLSTSWDLLSCLFLEWRMRIDFLILSDVKWHHKVEGRKQEHLQRGRKSFFRPIVRQSVTFVRLWGIAFLPSWARKTLCSCRTFHNQFQGHFSSHPALLSESEKKNSLSFKLIATPTTNSQELPMMMLCCGECVRVFAHEHDVISPRAYCMSVDVNKCDEFLT